MLRIELFLFASLVLGLASNAQAQTFQSRTWTDISGKFSVDATYVSATDKDVSIQNSEGKVLSIPRGKLCKNDQDFIKAANLLAIIESQESKLNQHIATLIENPSQSIEFISAIQRSEPTDPIAALWCGVSYATEAGKAGYSKAERYFDDSLTNLRNLHKHFPDAQPKTLVAALNNRAVLALRERKLSRVTTLYKELAIVSPQLNPVVSHNIKLVLNIAKQPRTTFEISTSEERLLSELIVNAADVNSINLPPRFLYSTDFDSATSALPSQLTGDKLHQLKQQRIWPELTCFSCDGMGVIDCPACVSGVTRTFKTEQVGFNNINNTPVMAQKVYKTPCRECNARGKFACPHCENGRLKLGN